MNPLLALKWCAENWRLLAFLAVLAAFGVQSYRLQGAQGEARVLALEKSERARRDGMRDMQATKNRERTDEEDSSARRRAGAVVVRSQPARIVGGEGLKPAGGGEAAAQCIGRGRLDEELAGWVEWHAEGLSAVLARISRRGDEALTGSAREGEDVAAAYRAARAWALGLP